MKRKEQSIQILTILKWFAKFAIYIIIYHLIVAYVFDYTIIYMKAKDYEELEKNMETLRSMLWWVEYL